jgi:hypothetical protein
MTHSARTFPRVHSAMQRHVSDGEIGRLAAFDELHGMLTMVVSAFAGAAVSAIPRSRAILDRP